MDQYNTPQVCTVQSTELYCFLAVWLLNLMLDDDSNKTEMVILLAAVPCKLCLYVEEKAGWNPHTGWKLPFGFHAAWNSVLQTAGERLSWCSVTSHGSVERWVPWSCPEGVKALHGLQWLASAGFAQNFIKVSFIVCIVMNLLPTWLSARKK